MIEVKHVTKRFGDYEVLNDISFNIHKGELLFIVGDSGAGKTTLLNLIGGLDNPTQGEVIFDGKNIFEDINWYRSKKVGFIFQDYNLIQSMSVEKNIKLATFLSGDESFNSENLCKQFGIEKMNKKAGLLSGGEKQRVAIARSICKNSEIIIADEPTGNLDSKNSEKIISYLNEIKKNKYVVIVTHNEEIAQKYGDRIIKVSDGQISVEKEKEITVTDKAINTETVSKNKKNNLKAIMMLGANSTKSKVGRLIIMTVAIALTLMAVSVTPFMINGGYEIQNNVNVSYLENDLVSVYYGITANTGRMECPIDDDLIDKITGKYKTKEIVPKYYSDYTDWVIEYGNTTSKVDIKQVCINSFFEERIMQNDISGKFISNDEEIIISEENARELFKDPKKGIGEKITLHDGMGNSVELKVVGINHTQNAYDTYFSIISNEIPQKLLNQKITNMLSVFTEINTYNEETEHRTQASMCSSGVVYGAVKEINGDENIVAGSAAKEKNDILLSSDFIEMMFGDSAGREKKIEEFLSETYCMNCNGVFPVHITGFYESDENGIRISKELIDEIYVIEPVIIDIYAANKEVAQQIKNDVSKEGKYKASYKLETLKDNVMSETMYFMNTIKIIDILLVMISIALIISYVKMTMVERKKEVAIIKSLGATDNVTLAVLLYDYLMIAVLSIAFVFLLSFVAIKVITHMNTWAKIINFNGVYKYELIVAAVFVAAILLLVTFLLKRMTRKSPAELLKQ